jgi:hypothetical protein
MEDVLDLYCRPADPMEARLCFDERPCQLPGDVLVPLALQPGQAARHDYEYARHGTAVILLAYDLDSGQRYLQVRATHQPPPHATNWPTITERSILTIKQSSH